jgi:hypothetical protein
LQFTFGPSEYVKEIAGTTGTYDGIGFLSLFKMVTNTRTYGPFGTQKNQPFSFVVPQDETVVGFFAKSRPSTAGVTHVTSVGVYTV